MTLKEKIQEDLKEGQKGKNEFLVSVLRMMIAAINNKEIEKRTKLVKIEQWEKLEELSKLTDAEVIDILMSEVKKRREAASAFEEGGRIELAEKEKQEIEVLQNYLPQQLSAEEIVKMVKEAIKKVGAKEPKDMGKVMAELMPKIRGRAEGSVVTKIVKDLLISK